MHGSSVKYKTCTFTLRLRAKNHRTHLSSYYSSGSTDIYTQVNAAVRQGLMQTLLSQCKTLISFISVWRSIMAFKQRGQLTSAITLEARFATREVRQKLLLLSAVIGLRPPSVLKLEHRVTVCCTQKASRNCQSCSRPSPCCTALPDTHQNAFASKGTTKSAEEAQ